MGSGRLQNQRAGMARNLPVHRPWPAMLALRFSITAAGRPTMFNFRVSHMCYPRRKWVKKLHKIILLGWLYNLLHQHLIQPTQMKMSSGKKVTKLDLSLKREG